MTTSGVSVHGRGHVDQVIENEHTAYQRMVRMLRIGLWLFIISDSFMFAGLFVSRFYLLGGTRPELSQALGLIVTSVLLASSFYMNRAETLIEHGDREGFLRCTLITIGLGLGFFVGVVFLEWPLAASHIGGPAASAMSSVFFMMTGMHAFHVITGILFLLVIYFNGRNGRYTPERHWMVEACANYWHFVDVVWIFFYPALYLIGTPVALKP